MAEIVAGSKKSYRWGNSTYTEDQWKKLSATLTEIGEDTSKVKEVTSGVTVNLSLELDDTTYKRLQEVAGTDATTYDRFVTDLIKKARKSKGEAPAPAATGDNPKPWNNIAVISITADEVDAAVTAGILKPEAGEGLKSGDPKKRTLGPVVTAKLREFVYKKRNPEA